MMNNDFEKVIRKIKKLQGTLLQHLKHQIK